MNSIACPKRRNTAKNISTLNNMTHKKYKENHQFAFYLLFKNVLKNVWFSGNEETRLIKEDEVQDEV